MVQLIVDILWFLIILILLAAVVYLAIWVIEKFIYPIPELVKQGIWVIALLLALIFLLTTLLGGRAPFRPFTKSGLESGTLTALSAPATRHHSPRDPGGTPALMNSHG